MSYPEGIEPKYDSPRWSGEITDCSMPMTFDTYSVCSYNCLYCFAFFQKSHCVTGYMSKKPFCVSVEKVRKLFEECLNNNPDALPYGYRQFYPYIKNRTTMQWGGMADGFDEFERRFGISLQLLQVFDEFDYPLSISTKGAWWTKDERYMSLLRKHSHNWHFKISIITSNPLKARAIERGVSAPKERIEAIRAIADAGNHVTLRLRPYIIGLSEDYRKTILDAHEAGADSVTTEFFCLESRADSRLKAKYAEMSKIVGYDIYEFYRQNTLQKSGYRRLRYDLKRPIIEDMKEIAHNLGMRFYVSDAHCKEQSDYCCCCGVPPEWVVSRGHFAEALQIAKTRGDGIVYWHDIAPDLKKFVGDVLFYRAAGFNTNSNQTRAEKLNQTLYDHVHALWNTPSGKNSPYGYFEGILYPIGVDQEQNVIYKLNRAKAERSDWAKRGRITGERARRMLHGGSP